MVTVARFSSVVGAVVWLVGLVFVGFSGAIFTSDSTYFWFGVLAALIGLATTPVALTYPAASPALSRVVKGSGVMVCAVLVLTGALLVAGSSGWLGDRAPGWLPSTAEIGTLALFGWVLLASYSSRRSITLGGWVFWLGMLVGATVLIPTLVSVLVFFLDPGFTFTNATVLLDLVLYGLVWLCFPAWLIAFAVRMRPGTNTEKSLGASDRVEVADLANRIDAPTQTPPVTPS